MMENQNQREDRDWKIPSIYIKEYEQVVASLDNVLTYCNSSREHGDSTEVEAALAQTIPQFKALLTAFLEVQKSKAPTPGMPHVPHPLLWRTLRGLYRSEIHSLLKELEDKGEIYQERPGFYRLVDDDAKG